MRTSTGLAGARRLAPRDMSVASAALRAARSARGAALAGLASGVLSMPELIELAMGDEGVALRRILVHSLLAELGCPERRRDELFGLLRRICHVDSSRAPGRRLTLGWICDRRSTGRRSGALADALVACVARDGVRPPATPGWPYAGPPPPLQPSRSRGSCTG
jgi:hypothetical protein